MDKKKRDTGYGWGHGGGLRVGIRRKCLGWEKGGRVRGVEKG